jgi:phosphoenolpyruvate-protein kinase (PTS system EI component)
LASEKIRTEKISAKNALIEVCQKQIENLEKTNISYFQQRTADIKDV